MKNHGTFAAIGVVLAFSLIACSPPLTNTTEAVSIGAQSGIVYTDLGGTVSFPVTTANVTGGTSGTVTWYTDRASTTPTTAPAGVVATASPVSNNAARVGMTVDKTAVVAGTSYFTVTYGEVTSSIATVTIFAPWVSTTIGNGKLRGVPAGTFNNGVSNVTVSAFYMSQYEITQAQYQAVMGTNPSYFTGDTSRPVEQVSWYDALVFCNKLSILEGKTPVYSIGGSTDPSSWGTVPTSSDATWNAAAMNRSANGYRLPTEAEWEFAAWGGNATHGYTYAGSNTIGDVAWYSDNAGSTSHSVGMKAANELGLYDMSGNVWEWCWDWSGSYPSGAQTDPTGASSGTYRVEHGGSWGHGTSICAVAKRYNLTPEYRSYAGGFRVVAR